MVVAPRCAASVGVSWPRGLVAGWALVCSAHRRGREGTVRGAVVRARQRLRANRTRRVGVGSEAEGRNHNHAAARRGVLAPLALSASRGSSQLVGCRGLAAERGKRLPCRLAGRGWAVGTMCAAPARSSCACRSTGSAVSSRAVSAPAGHPLSLAISLSEQWQHRGFFMPSAFYRARHPSPAGTGRAGQGCPRFTPASPHSEHSALPCPACPACPCILDPRRGRTRQRGAQLGVTRAHPAG